ncbi:trigger factor [Lysobacteraceae bacterium NML75-0749]|nr:trigger factor [Xanthomonadaceae bacterium NML75-0749]PJK01978.1 trigger factor [Xanthomonadaceae bacterium NML03-0222]PJK05043.1 trigger factor [Xanthomonadaceae bacterium NML91-0268]
MQVSIESTGDLGRRVLFRVPSAEVEGKLNTRLREIARDARIKGFRPGKVPTSVIAKRFGAQVRAEILDGLLREGFGNALKDETFQIAGNPRIEEDKDNSSEGELAYVADFEVVPEFGEIDLGALNVVRNTATVEEADIDTMIENLREQRSSWSAVERASANGDLVEVEMFSEVDGVRLPAEGAERGQTVLGSGALFAPIEEAVAGLAAGESKTVKVDFPADWRVEQLAGKSADVTVKALQVAELKRPEVDHAFIRSFGVKSGEAEQFREEIRSNLERELKGALMFRLRRAVGEQIIEKYGHITMPPKLVEQEAQAMAANAQQEAQARGQQLQVDAQQFMDAAGKRVLIGLFTGEVARRNKLQLDRNRLMETMRLIASTYEEPEQVFELYRNDPQLLNQLQYRVMEEQVTDWIAEKAEHTEVPMSFQDAIRAE